MVAEAEGLLPSSVMPRSVSDLTWPRSTSSVPVQPDVHQSVPASPSIAFDAGSPDSALVALAVLDKAHCTVGAKPGPAPPARAVPPGCAWAGVVVMAMTASGIPSTTAQAPAASRGCLLAPSQNRAAAFLSVSTGSPSNRHNFGPKSTAPAVFGQAEIDCFVLSYKKIFF